MYTSHDTRKVLEHLRGAGVTINDTLNLEIQVGLYWPNHIIGVCDKILKTPAAVEKANKAGWLGYFDKPVDSMLKTRAPAHRTKQISPANWFTPTYNAVTRGFLVADFTMDELKLLLVDIPFIVENDRQKLTTAMMACKERGQRTIYYLHGVLRRQAAMAAGMRKAAQEQKAEVQPWTPPEDYEPMDVVEIAMARADRPERLNDARIASALNNFAKGKK